MIKVRRIGHASFETPDLERQIDYYSQVVGLVPVVRERDRAFLAARTGPLALELTRAGAPRCTKLSFEVAANEDFADMAKRLAADGRIDLLSALPHGTGQTYLRQIILTALLSLFLALNKRRFELVRLAGKASEHREVLEKYSAYYIDQMCAAITASVLVVYMLYTLDPRQIERFGSHNLVYSIPFVWYGVFRYQYLVFKKELGGDPAKIVLSDRFILLDILIWVTVCAFGIYARHEWVPFVIS